MERVGACAWERKRTGDQVPAPLISINDLAALISPE